MPRCLNAFDLPCTAVKHCLHRNIYKVHSTSQNLCCAPCFTARNEQGFDRQRRTLLLRRSLLLCAPYFVLFAFSSYLSPWEVHLSWEQNLSLRQLKHQRHRGA